MPENRLASPRAAALIVFALLAACARPLTPNEALVAKGLFGDALDADAVQIKAGIGVLPLPREAGPEPGAEPRIVAAPKGLCDRKRATSRTYAWPAAFVLGNSVYFSHRYYSPDAFRGLPESAPWPASVLLAHELVHVWQWQNRARTAYTPEGAAGETIAQVDPYWFDAAGRAEFFALGYEQQGALVQDFVCYALFDRNNPKLNDLTAVLRPVLPVDDFLAGLRPR